MSQGLKGVKVGHGGSEGEYNSPSTDMDALRPSSRMELLAVSRLSDDSRMSESSGGI